MLYIYVLLVDTSRWYWYFEVIHFYGRDIYWLTYDYDVCEESSSQRFIDSYLYDVCFIAMIFSLLFSYTSFCFFFCFSGMDIEKVNFYRDNGVW